MFEAKKLFGFLFILLILATSAHAQDTTGIINGRVADASGAVIPGVDITLTGPAIQGSRTTLSGETGAYQFLLLPEGTYTLKFGLPGFKTLVREGIIVQVLKTTTINVSLEVSTVAETVTVTGESPVVDVQNATVGVNFNQSMLRDIPNSRDIWIVLSQSPGINATRYDVGGSTMGSQTSFRAYGTAGQNTFNLDGINTTDGSSSFTASSGSAGWYFDYGSFSEMQVSAAGNSAEVQTPGAFVNTTIKSGGNDVHGQVYIDWENQNFQGTNVTDQMARVCPTNATTVAAFGGGPCGLYTRDAQGVFHKGGDQFQRYNDFNAQIGGPIKKDKLWWFFSWRDQYSGLFTQLGLNDSAETKWGLPVDATSIVGGGTYTTRLRIPTVKFNYQITPKNQFIFTWQHSRKHAPYRNGQGANAYKYIVESTGDQRDPSDGRKWELTSIVSPRLTLDFKATDSQYIFPEYTHTDKINITDNTTGFIRGGFSGFDEWRKHWDWGGNLSYFNEGFLGLNHNFKFGYDVYYESTRDFNLGNPGGLQLSVNDVNGVQTPSQFTIQDNPYQSENSMFQNAAYAQDKIEIRHRLTINVGVRWDRYHPYYPNQGNPGTGPFGDPAALGIGAYAALPQATVTKTYVASFDNVVPRFSLAFDLFGDGKTALKASAGKYDWDPSFGLASNANPNRGATWTYAWDGTLPITPAYVLSNGKALFKSSSVPTSTVIDPKLSNSWTDQYSVGIDHQLINDLGVRANYVRVMEQNPYASVNTAININSFTPVTITDPGRDGIVGSGDDQQITVYNLLPAFRGVNNTLITNFKGLGSNYSSLELSMQKRMSNKWMAQVSWDVTKRNLRQDISNDPNTLNWGANSNIHYWDWAFKSVFMYQLPYGVNFTTTFNSQKGETFTRQFTASNFTQNGVTSTFNQGNLTINAEHNGQNFYPTIKLWNMRAEKQFKITEKQTIAGMIDWFNLTNQNTATGWTTSSNAVYTYQNQITAILNPRIFRLGARYTF
jgi:hypothetical protein